MRRWTTAMAIAAVLGASALAGCSDGDDGGGGADGGGGDFCAAVREFEALQTEGDALFASDDATPEQLRDVYSRFSDSIDDLLAAAPDDIEPDARLVGETTQQLIAAFERADYDFQVLATDPQYAEVLASLDTARVTEANDRLATYVRDECGAPAGTTDTTDTTG
ncbi:MAG: hypothetical protein U0Q03_08060 [Acidimicrobiales bacterium]